MSEVANEITNEVRSLASELRATGRVLSSDLHSTSTMFRDMQRAMLRRVSAPAGPSTSASTAASEDPSAAAPALPRSATSEGRLLSAIPKPPPVQPLWTAQGCGGDTIGNAPDLGPSRRSASLPSSGAPQVDEIGATGARCLGTDLGLGWRFNFEPQVAGGLQVPGRAACRLPVKALLASGGLTGSHSALGLDTELGVGGLTLPYSTVSLETGFGHGALTTPLPRYLALGRGVASRGPTRADRRASQPSLGLASQQSRTFAFDRQLGALDDRLGKLDESFRRFASASDVLGTGPSASMY